MFPDTLSTALARAIRDLPIPQRMIARQIYQEAFRLGHTKGFDTALPLTATAELMKGCRT